MQSSKSNLLSTTMVPLVVLAGVAAGDAVIGTRVLAPPARAACNPCAVKRPSPCNPCAAAKSNPCAAAKCNPCAAAKCNPCAAAKCNPCNPCAAAGCNPCSPCSPCAAAGCNPCNPCNPCAAGGGAVSLKCAVPRLSTVALRNPCSPCNPCNPCAAKRGCNPCNPCAAAKCNPCNPCAAKRGCNPCNPCAAAKCNPCNPCAAANPCSPCNPCNPCAAGGGVELTDAEAVTAYDCLLPQLKTSYARSDNRIAVSYASWRRYSTQAYQSATHGNRYVQNYANNKAKGYALFENAGRMPAGAQLAKDSFSVRADGALVVGPLFIMEKMDRGFNQASDDWRYTMVMPDGSIFGTTKGRGSGKVEFCIGCHKAVAPEVDSMMFLPAEYRVPR